MNIHVPGQPRHLKISAGMIEDLVMDPVLAARLILGVRLDAFQANRLRYYWWVPFTLDSSGVSSGKTLVSWVYCQLRAVLIGNHFAGVYFPTFGQGKSTFWVYYNSIALRSAIFQAQIGFVGLEEEKLGKAQTKDPDVWVCRFRNESQVQLPAPSILLDAKTQAGRRYNTLVVDEVNKVIEMSEDALDKQLMGRVTRPSWNQHHPIWGNQVKLLSTAEDLNHPAANQYLEYIRQEKSGDANYHTLGYSFKDYSNLPSLDGQTFRQLCRIDEIMRAQKLKLQRRSRARWLQEGLGIWARSDAGWYSSQSLGACVALGRSRKLDPMLGRGDNEGDDVHYFYGGDPAPSVQVTSDAGAICILRAVPRVTNPTDVVADWKLDLVYARLVRKHTTRQWSGLNHFLHQRFGFSAMVIDAGAAGGGVQISQEMEKERQLMPDGERDVTPLAAQDRMMVLGDFIVALFKRGGKVGIEELWPKLQGDDLLKDRAYSVLKEALDAVEIGIPVPFNQRPREETMEWGMEKEWVGKCITQLIQQALRIRVVTRNDGESFDVTSRGAHKFACRGKDDLLESLVYAYVAFLWWLRTGARWNRLPPEDEVGAGVAGVYRV